MIQIQHLVVFHFLDNPVGPGTSARMVESSSLFRHIRQVHFDHLHVGGGGVDPPWTRKLVGPCRQSRLLCVSVSSYLHSFLLAVCSCMLLVTGVIVMESVVTSLLCVCTPVRVQSTSTPHSSSRTLTVPVSSQTQTVLLSLVFSKLMMDS